MAIFEQERLRFPGASPPTGLRAEAEAYAASLGQVRGTPGWGDAVRGYVRNLAGRRSVREAARPRHGFEEDQPKPPGLLSILRPPSVASRVGSRPPRPGSWKKGFH